MIGHADVLPIPRLLAGRLDAAASAFLAEAGPRIDFSQPPGEAALVPADSVSWRIFKNQVALFIGGVTAVLLEMAEPKVRDGVWQHSSFRTDALKRMQRTGLAALMTVYGARSQAEKMIAGVVSRHGRVTGRTTDGEAYEANDTELLDWVQATASYGFMRAYHIYAAPLTQTERDAFLAEAKPAAELYGAAGAPTSERQLDALMEQKKERLVPSPVVFEFLDIMSRVPALPALARPLQILFLKAAVELLPPWLRARLGLGRQWSLSFLERQTVKVAAATADRLLLRSLPPVQSCRRLGLPDDYLYRRAH
ncbi:DUF2236 domain-containing protein [Rhizobium deserti]|uniref:DUF2236 domain-containing protein n=1 Tax=Rhizobium deserti TaxID=2547961 RepID=A0A4R5UMB7_9HYPH|nr:oxygenase MpaB family protein [Rhizobium deserti]TDK39012.1 DUF2236 domain-containing protein [Rhizobium deserti]